MDLKSRDKWLEYSRAKDEMFKYTDTKQSPWYVVPADNKKRARLNCINHLLGMIDFMELEHENVALSPRNKEGGYIRPPFSDQTFVPEKY